MNCIFVGPITFCTHAVIKAPTVIRCKGKFPKRLRKKISVTKMPIRVRDDETSVATDDAGSNAAGFIKKYTSPNDFIQKLNGAGPLIGVGI